MTIDYAAIGPVRLALFATLFTWAVTAVGAATVFAGRGFGTRLLGAMNGFAAGVMIAASFWSLLAPAIEMSRGAAVPSFVPPAAGFLLGAAFLMAADKVLPHVHPDLPRGAAEGPPVPWGRRWLVVLAITLHNVPEGLAVGVAFGAAAAGVPSASYDAAIALALGIGLQNFPEGVAVAMPLRADGMSRGKSFFVGQLSAVVEPVAGVLGAALVSLVRPSLPYALAFAAGAMMFVVVEELIPASQRQGDTDVATASTLLGFVVMMGLDVGLGG